MRACFFSRLVSDHVHGGLQTDLDSRARWLVERGHEVTVLTTAHPQIGDVRTRDGVSLHFLKGTSPERQNSTWRRRSLERFLELHRSNPFDLVIMVGGGGWQYARLRKLHRDIPPVVMLMQSPLLWNLAATMRKPSPLNLARSFWSLYYLTCWNRPYGRSVEAVLVLSESVRRAALAEGSFNDEQIHVIPNGVNTGLFRPGEPPRDFRERWGVRPDDPVAIWVSRFRAEKGWRETLDTAVLLRKRFPRFRLILAIAGLRSGRARLMNLIQKLDLTSCVIVAEDVPHSKLAEYYRAADVLLAPLYGPEGQPLIIIEAMACGLAIVASAIESVAEIVVNDTYGSLVSRFTDPLELAKAAIPFLENREVRARAGLRCRERVLAIYDEQVTSKRTVDLLERIAGMSGAVMPPIDTTVVSAS